MLAFVAFFAYLSIKIYRWGSSTTATRLADPIVREALRGSIADKPSFRRRARKGTAVFC